MSAEQEWRRIAEHAVRYPTVTVGSNGPSPATRLGDAVLALLARLDALVAAITEGGFCKLCDWSEVDGAIEHAEECPVRRTVTASTGAVEGGE